MYCMFAIKLGSGNSEQRDSVRCRFERGGWYLFQPKLYVRSETMRCACCCALGFIMYLYLVRSEKEGSRRDFRVEV